MTHLDKIVVMIIVLVVLAVLGTLFHGAVLTPATKPNTLCFITPAGVVVRAPAYTEHSCQDWRAIVAHVAFRVHRTEHQAYAPDWLCYLLDPCTQTGE